MGAASKYLLRQPSTEPVEPERLTEIDALSILNAATERASCGLCEVGPLVAHLVGPVAAAPPEGHRNWFKLRAPGDPLRRPSALAEQLTRTCGALAVGGLVACTCDGLSRHPLAVIMRHISRARIIRVHHNSQATHERLDAAFRSGDVDRLTYEFEPRLECLKILVDRARAAHGGDLPDLVIEAVATLAQTLVGPTRWDIRRGWDMIDWEPGWRVGATFETAQSILVQDFIADRVMIRLIEGR